MSCTAPSHRRTGARFYSGGLLTDGKKLEHGGVSDATRAKLRAHAADLGLGPGDEKVARLRRRSQPTDGPVPGTKLVRIWHGDRYEVTAVAGGFEFDGRKFRSLTAVAKAITGAHWNGRVFFGISKQRKRKP